jgi:Rne/Rng family ribonuclease
MNKELIISSNIHEKKVAILEDGAVAEFYVEREHENQGVVGNIYKGRVVRVLPGMQSAFVDIGLERDAFLYVADFADLLEEEEEIDFRDIGEPAPAKTPEQPPDERAKPEEIELGEAVEQLAEIADEGILAAPTAEREEVTKEIPPAEIEAEQTPEIELTATSQETEEEASRSKRNRRKNSKARRVAHQEAPGAESKPRLERVTDEDIEQEPGNMLKDAMIQEKIFSHVRQEEYSVTEAEQVSEPEWKLGSIKKPGEAHFQRVLDEEPEASPLQHISNALKSWLSKLGPSEGESTEPPEPDSEQDRQASLRDNHGRAELALRRGGRRRRRRSQAAAEEEKATFEATATEEVGPETKTAPEAKRKGKPLITELLHEGQEILVQIAKEPIAKKGARITSHITLPGRYLVYMPTVNHIGVSRKIASEIERARLRRVVTALRDKEGAAGGFIARTACEGHSEQELHEDMLYLLRTWADIKKKAERVKAPALIHRDLDLVQRILRDLLSDDFSAIRVDNEDEYARIVEFVNRINPKLIKRVKLYTGNQPILEKYGVQGEIDKAVRPRVWLKSGGYIVINQTEALVAIDVNTGKFVGKSDRLEDTITKTNLEAAKEIVRQIRLRDLGGIIVIDFIDMEERKNRQKVMQALQQELQSDRSPSKILSINDFGLVAITRKRVRQSLERTLCTPCPYCQGAGMVKSQQTMCFEILEQAKALSRQVSSSSEVTLRVSPDVAETLRTTERAVFEEIEAYFGVPVTIEADPKLHREQFDFAIV